MRSAIAILLLACGAAMAQMPRVYFPWWESRIARDIHLSEAQREKVREVQRKYRDRMIDLRAAVEKAEARLRDLYEMETVDPAQAEQVIDELVKYRGEMTRALAEMSLELRQVLTLEQWRELQEKVHRMRERRWGRPGYRLPRGGQPRAPRPPRQPAPPPAPPEAPAPPAPGPEMH